MARFKSQLRKWCDKIPDWVLPHLTGETEPYKDEQLSITSEDADLLREVEHVLTIRNSQVDERLRGIETKLLALLTLTSVLSAALTAISFMDTPEDYLKVPTWLVVIVVFYIAINLLCSLWATVNGLVRRNFRQLRYKDMVPKDREDSIHYKMRILNENLGYTSWNEYILNKKVSEMAVAHAALRNVLGATGGLILLAFTITVFKIIQ